MIRILERLSLTGDYLGDNRIQNLSIYSLSEFYINFVYEYSIVFSGAKLVKKRQLFVFCEIYSVN